MKARQSSIYRKLENLLGALMAVSERVPKNAMGLQTAMSRCINEVVDSLGVCEYALRAIDINQRIAYIATLIHSLTIVKTIVRELHEYSRKEKSGMVNVDGEAKLVKVPLYGRSCLNTSRSFSQNGSEVCPSAISLRSYWPTSICRSSTNIW